MNKMEGLCGSNFRCTVFHARMWGVGRERGKGMRVIKRGRGLVLGGV